MTSPAWHTSLVRPNGQLTQPLIDFLRKLGSAQDVSSLQAAITELQEQVSGLSMPVVLQELANLTPGLVTRLSGNTWEVRNIESADATRIVVTDGDGQAGNPTVDLAELTDTGVGAALVKITRDDYGRVEGTEAATAADLPYDNATSGLTATDVQAAIDEVKAIADAADLSAVFVPYFIASGETFTVPEYKQALFHMPIDCEGSLVVDGYLVEV